MPLDRRRFLGHALSAAALPDACVALAEACAV